MVVGNSNRVAAARLHCLARACCGACCRAVDLLALKTGGLMLVGVATLCTNRVGGQALAR